MLLQSCISCLSKIMGDLQPGKHQFDILDQKKTSCWCDLPYFCNIEKLIEDSDSPQFHHSEKITRNVDITSDLSSTQSIYWIAEYQAEQKLLTRLENAPSPCLKNQYRGFNRYEISKIPVYGIK